MKTFTIPLDDARAARLVTIGAQLGLSADATLAVLAVAQIDALGDGPASLANIQACAAEQRGRAQMAQANAAWRDELAAEPVPEWAKR